MPLKCLCFLVKPDGSQASIRTGVNIHHCCPHRAELHLISRYYYCYNLHALIVLCFLLRIHENRRVVLFMFHLVTLTLAAAKWISCCTASQTLSPANSASAPCCFLPVIYIVTTQRSNRRTLSIMSNLPRHWRLITMDCLLCFWFEASSFVS